MANKSIVGFEIKISTHQDQHIFSTLRNKTCWVCSSPEERQKIEQAFIDYFNKVVTYLGLAIDDSKTTFFIQDEIDKLKEFYPNIKGGKDCDRECMQFTMVIDNMDFTNRKLQIHAYPCHFEGNGGIGYTMSNHSIRDFKFTIK